MGLHYLWFGAAMEDLGHVPCVEGSASEATADMCA
jgi:hypothetical protein